MTTEKRPKLTRDWPSPFRETIPAGTIGHTKDAYYAFPFGPRDDVDDDENLECVLVGRATLDWFTLVDWCLTCEREVCPSPVMCCGGESVHDHDSTVYCHGHADKCKTCGKVPCAVTAIDEETCQREDLCHGHDELKPEPKPFMTVTDAPTPRPELTCLSACGECDALGPHRMLDFEVDQLRRLDDGSIACPECGNSVEAYSAYACCISGSHEWGMPDNACGTFKEPKPEPPYPVPEDALNFWLQDTRGVWWCNRESYGDNYTRWRTREHAEHAAKAHAKLDEVLQNAFNVSAGAVEWGPRTVDDDRDGFRCYASNDDGASAYEYWANVKQGWPDERGAIGEADLLNMIHNAKPVEVQSE